MKKKNPQDATLRNIRALKKKVARIEECLGSLIFCSEYLGVTGRQDLLELLTGRKKK